jgi:hypothetical protein
MMTHPSLPPTAPPSVQRTQVFERFAPLRHAQLHFTLIEDNDRDAVASYRIYFHDSTHSLRLRLCGKPSSAKKMLCNAFTKYM